MMKQTMTTTNDANNLVTTDHDHKISTADLLQGNKNLIIEHGDEQYLLTVTRSNKLILTK
jgi:hemin uptake protein HemP